MDSLSNILSRKDFDEPDEITSIKRYILNELGVNVGVQLADRHIVISVPSAALANTLRLRTPDIKKHCKIDKRLTFRIAG